MELCKEGHVEVCYEGITCPFCEAIEGHEAQVFRLKEELDRLEGELYELEA